MAEGEQLTVTKGTKDYDGWELRKVAPLAERPWLLVGVS